MRRCAILLLLAGPVAAAAPAGDAPSGKVVLDNRTPFRCHLTWRTDQVRRADGSLAYVRVEYRGRGRTRLSPAETPTGTAPPPAGWERVDFDDSAWPRARPPLYTRGTREIALICARAKFHVTDPPSAGPMTLKLTYRGGALVRLNGAELARGHLPKGEIGLDTPGADYPKEAYVAPEGDQLRWIGFGDPEKHPDRFALRDRTLTMTVPASALRRGLNVLAVELHRAPASEVLYTAKYRDDRRYSLWDMIALEQVELAARVGGEVSPNVSRPRGLQVWNHPIFRSVHNVDFGDPNDPLRAIEIVAARNGVFSGQVVVGSDRPIRGLRGAVTALTGPGGSSIPAEAVRVRYGLPSDHGAENHNEDHRLRRPVPYGRARRRFDGLGEEPPGEVPVDPPAGGAVVPVWVTVRVPPGAPAGRYAGTLAISAEGAEPVKVPVTLDVVAWALPDPKDFQSFLGLVQSPESLALHYHAAMWSPEHWRLIDRSFEWMGRLGVKTVYLPVLARTYFGNEHSRVRWIRDGDGWKHDFGIVERYLDTAVKHLGKVPVVCAYCWEVSTGSKYMGLDKYKFADNTGMPFTVLDPVTGRLTPATGPTWGDGEVRAFWQPVLAGLRERLAKRGLTGSLMVGISGDRRPNPEAVADLAAAGGGAPWVSSSHNAPVKLFDQPVGYASVVWGVGMAPDPAEKRWCGWKNPSLLVAFPRYGSGAIGHGIRTAFAVGCYRIGMESALTSPGGSRGLRGVGRCGADFWDVLPGPRGSRASVLGRFPESKAWHGGWLHNSTPYVLAPGRSGPVATARFEALREGIQETEARIFLEQVLNDPTRRGRIGEGLARRCQGVLDERVRANRRALAGGGRYLTWVWFAGSGVHQRAKELYAAAGEVARALRQVDSAGGPAPPR